MFNSCLNNTTNRIETKYFMRMAMIDRMWVRWDKMRLMTNRYLINQYRKLNFTCTYLIVIFDCSDYNIVEILTMTSSEWMLLLENTSEIGVYVIACLHISCINPDSKVHGANMGPTWVLSAPDGPHIGPMNLAIRECMNGSHSSFLIQNENLNTENTLKRRWNTTHDIVLINEKIFWKNKYDLLSKYLIFQI